jgi:beta-galactosidase
VGHPDIAAFHHDLYRGMCKGRWWVSEQQPGAVNWAQWNPAPAPGMVRLWTWQAFAHGAEAVNYFRWRQAPFAQEQMHAGLHRCDDTLAAGGAEAALVAEELRALAPQLAGHTAGARVALVFDYQAQWMAQITPHGADFSYLELAFTLYSQLRQLGLDVDIVGPDADLARYALLVLPAQMHIGPALAARLQAFEGELVLGPRSGSKSADFSVEASSPLLAALAGVRVLGVESLPPGVVDAVDGLQHGAHATRWREALALQGAQAEAWYVDGQCAVARQGRCHYVGAWLDEQAWRELLARAARSAGLAPERLADGVRVSRLGRLLFVFNFSSDSVSWAPPGAAQCLSGQASLPALHMSIWRTHG